jgi:hypothetical protein
MRGPINVKSPNNITNWQMRFNSAFKGLTDISTFDVILLRLLTAPLNNMHIERGAKVTMQLCYKNV